MNIFGRSVLVFIFGSAALAQIAQAQNAATPSVPIVAPSSAVSPVLAPPELSAPAAPITPLSPDAVAPAAPIAPAAPQPPLKPKSNISIEIDLQKQHAYLLRDGRKIAESPISSGRFGHLTPRGDFSVIEKDPNHFSSLYGKIVEKGSGRVVVSGADAAMPVPRGCKFVPAPMKYFLRFEGAAGMHAGILPGYPASHGCVRMPAEKAKLFYTTAEVGSSVHIFGDAPVRSTLRVAASPRKTTVHTAARQTEQQQQQQTQQHAESEEIATQPEPPPQQVATRRSWFSFFPR